jgi:NitT/TauT family transport system substrate-binding protein
MRESLFGRLGLMGAALATSMVLMLTGPAEAQSTGPATLKYGAPTATPGITTVGVYFAADNGLFKREGIDVQVTRYPGSTTAMRALLAGDADVVEIGGDTAFLAMESGARIGILLSPVARSTDVVVTKASVASLSDMRGKSFAVSSPGSPGDILGRLLFKRNGVDPSQIQFVALGSPADRIRALLGGKVDGTSATILVIGPVLDAIAKGEARVLASIGEQFPAIPLSYVVATQTFIRSHRDVLVRFVRAEVEGLRWAQTNPDDAAQLAAKYIRETPLPVLTQGMREMARMKVYGLDGGISERGIEETQQMLKELGQIKSVSKPAEVAAFDLLQDALKSLGPLR